MDRSTLHFLLARFMDTEYQTKLLANVSAKTFEQLKHDMLDRFRYDELTADDIKSAWKEWFDWAANNGTLISPELRFEDPAVNWHHDELCVVDLVIELANRAIDKL